MLWGNTVHIIGSNMIMPHRHEMHEMVVCLSGTGRHEIDGRTYEFRRGRTFFLPGMVPHQAIGTDSEPAEIAFVCFDPRIDAEQLPPSLRLIIADLVANRHYASGNGRAIDDRNLDISLLLQKEIKDHSPLGQHMSGSLLCQLILNHARTLSSSANRESDASFAKIAGLCAWIVEHPTSEFSLDHAARRAGMSRSLFTRQFRRYTGMSFIEYMVSIRMGKAVNLLTTTKYPVDEIAFRCGFRNLGYFYRMFQRHTNSTPRKLRNYIVETGKMPLK
jgi:AraC family transcriptional activator of mar-sox-rob regulon